MVTGVPHLPQFYGNWSVRPHHALKQVSKLKNIPYLDSYLRIAAILKNGKDVTECYWKGTPTLPNIKTSNHEHRLSFMSMDFTHPTFSTLLP